MGIGLCTWGLTDRARKAGLPACGWFISLDKSSRAFKTGFQLPRINRGRRLPLFEARGGSARLADELKSGAGIAFVCELATAVGWQAKGVLL